MLLQGQVCCLCADGVRGLLAAGDTAGSISVWENTEGKWQRRASFCFGGPGKLVDLLWTSTRGLASQASFCALYEDGHLVNASVEGHRLWSRDIRRACSRFCAVPNGSGFVLATKEGDLLIYDSRGVYLRKLAQKTEAAPGKTVAGK